MVLAGTAAGTPAWAQQQQQQPQTKDGGFYELGDYSYFEPQAIVAEPVLPVDPTPEPYPVPEPSPSPAPAPTPTPTPSAPSTGPTPAPAPGGGGSVPIGGYTPGAPMTYPQGDMAGARADANAFGKTKRSANGTITTSTNLATVPGYSASTLPQETLFDNPDALTSQGANAALASDPWRTVTNPDRNVITLDPNSLARAKAVEQDPDAYLAGQSLGAADGSCQPLPPSTTGTEYYEAMCEEGAKPIDEGRTCRAPLVVTVTPGGPPLWEYECDTFFNKWERNSPWMCLNFQRAAVGKTCTFVGNGISPRMRCLQGDQNFCTEPDFGETEIYQCTEQVDFPDGRQIGGGGTIASETVDETQCRAAQGSLSCTQTGEVCTGQPETRIIDGVSVTRPCWEWERTYQCTGSTQATDCGDLAGNPQCTFVRDECLDDPQVGACQVSTKVYRCPLPGGTPDGTSQYICGDDVYCINGDCEPIEREASTEFKDALVGLHTLGQANAEFDEATLTLFSGTRETCTKKVFGLSNCCSGKGVPLLTPFLCAAAERELDKKDDAGLCHRVGSYCSDKVLGICVTRKDAYCCFESKLSRILQEQGRLQINKPWGEPKKETCKGFTLAEFQQLDLSVMDFTEVYAEFIDAAKLPNELETTNQIQQRIEAYLNQNGTN
ncbi:conjugal transfer protein TraN [Qipengyuania citrea]|uniref:conjugal transfer protein TraN n=1 Tax=Qipengyuania citrea TaxID=225971 RepID=UPI003299CC22